MGGENSTERSTRRCATRVGELEASRGLVDYVEKHVSRFALPALACLALTTIGAASASPRSAPPPIDAKHSDTTRRDADDREIAPRGPRCPVGSILDGDVCV